MKKLVSLILMLMVVLTISAVPAKPGRWKSITLSDGTEVQVQLVGDERLHYWRSASGNCYQQDSTGTYNLIADVTALQLKAKALRVKVNTARKAMLKVPIDGTIRTYSGTKKGLVILVQFPDSKFQTADNIDLYKRILNEPGYSEGNFKGSVTDYFKAQSYNSFELDFDVVGPYTLSNNESYYGGNDSEGNDKNPGAMVKEACQAADKDVNYADYDWDGDGEVDQVFIVYAGLGEANGGDANTIWPHEWDLYSTTGSTLLLDGKVVSTYACGPELQPEYNSSGSVVGNVVDGIGTICHEFSHCLGFPDMYDIDYSGGNGMYTWDLMSTGSYLGDGYQPCGYTSYERMLAGWLTPVELNAEDKSILNMKALTNSPEAYVIYNQGHKDEYYLLENRQKTGWDASLYGAGLLVLHVDYDKTIWTNNGVNDDPAHQRLTPIAADGSTNYTIPIDGTSYLSPSLIVGDTYPYNKLDSLTRNSLPGVVLYNANSDGSYYMNHGLYGITQNADGTVSFDFKTNIPSHTSRYKAGDVIFSETFDKCNDTGGNDNSWSGTGVADGAFLPDMSGWASNKVYGADQCARFGTSTANGSAITPTFLLDGPATLTFKAAPWATASTVDGKSLTVLLNDKAINTCTMTPYQWNTYTMTISGSGSSTLTFSTSSKRFFLDEVEVSVPDAPTSGIKDIKSMNAVADGRIYNVNGQYVGTDLNALPRGLYIQNGKKIIK